MPEVNQVPETPELTQVFKAGNPKKPTRWLLCIVIALAVVILAGGDYYAWGKYGDTILTKLGIKKTETASTTTGTTATVDPTADWQTYTNTTYGFNFKYPSSYTPQDASEDLGESIVVSSNIKIFLFTADIDSRYGLNAPDGMDTAGITATDTTVGGKVAKIWPSTSLNSDFYVLSGNNHRIEIQLIKTNLSDTDQSNFTNLLNSVKFTTPDPTADWKTYTDSTLKISFKYPNTWTDVVLKKVQASNPSTGSTYAQTGDIDSDKVFNINFPSKDYTIVPVFTAYSKPIDPSWTKAQFSSALNSADNFLGYENLANKGIFVLDYTAIECSPGMNMKVYIPTNNVNYPNLIISAFSAGFVDDPSVKAFEAKQQAAGADACDQQVSYQAIADKIMAGTYSDKVASYKLILEQIAKSFSDL